MEFKIGQKVKIKPRSFFEGPPSKISIGAEGKPHPNFVKEMLEYCEKIMTIKEICKREFISFRFKEDEEMWSWGPWMVVNRRDKLNKMLKD